MMRLVAKVTVPYSVIPILGADPGLVSEGGKGMNLNLQNDRVHLHRKIRCGVSERIFWGWGPWLRFPSV